MTVPIIDDNGKLRFPVMPVTAGELIAWKMHAMKSPLIHIGEFALLVDNFREGDFSEIDDIEGGLIEIDGRDEAAIAYSPTGRENHPEIIGIFTGGNKILAYSLISFAYIRLRKIHAIENKDNEKPFPGFIVRSTHMKDDKLYSVDLLGKELFHTIVHKLP